MKKIFLAMLLSCSMAYAVEQGNSPFWNQPLDEVAPDIAKIIELQNAPSARATQSNEYVELQQIAYDQKEQVIAYTFRLKVTAEPEKVIEFVQDLAKVLVDTDCNALNFAHKDISNRYIIADKDGNIASKVTTSYKDCKFRESMVFRRN